MPLDNLTPQQSSRNFASIQEKNLQHLIKILGTKQSIEALTALGKTDKETWGKIADTVSGLKDFVIGGGISSFKEELRQIVKDEAGGILAPILNEFQPIIADLWEAFEPIMPFLVDAVTWIVEVLKPVIRWISDTIAAIIAFLTGASSAAELIPGLFQDLIDLAEPDELGDVSEPGGAYGGRIGRILDDPYGDY